MTQILGGGSGAAKRQAQKSREVQQIANDRQLAALRESESRTGATRRNPRGRRLFATNPEEKTTIS